MNFKTLLVKSTRETFESLNSYKQISNSEQDEKSEDSFSKVTFNIITIMSGTTNRIREENKILKTPILYTINNKKYFIKF